MSFILKWLGLHKPKATVGLRPHRVVTMPLGYESAYEGVRRAFDTVLGANVYVDDRAGRVIEGGFGLVNNERIRVSFTPIDSTSTEVHVEALFRAGAHVTERSQAVDALAAALASSSA